MATQVDLPLFMPHVPSGGADAVTSVLSGRWIGQGPRVDEFERRFGTLVEARCSLAVGSGTDALHLAYRLAGIEAGDEVITPVFTCTATNIPLLYGGAVPVFADVDPTTLNASVDDVVRRVTERTRAIVCVDYGGKPAELQALRQIADEVGIPLIEDAAHALGGKVATQPIGSIANYTIFSFQAIKHITTGDGGMLTFQDPSRLELAQRLRWFGIDRKAKLGGVWKNDIKDIGYKYQMTDLGAALGLAALDEFEAVLRHRQLLLNTYISELRDFPDVTVVGAPRAGEEHAAWLCTISVEGRSDLERWLAEAGIESGQVHYRNDRYSIFGGRRDDLPNMDYMEDQYLILPLHTRMSVDDVHRVCERIRQGW